MLLEHLLSDVCVKIDPIRKIQLLRTKFIDPGPLVSSLQSNSELWNRHTGRTASYGPHSAIDDIWVRYSVDGSSGPHTSVWYPGADKLTGIRDVCEKVRRVVNGKALGGVLITRIPGGQECKPHCDAGWHAEHYNLKCAIQLQGNKEQAFHFEDESLSALPGDLYCFQNQYLHWVTNPSNEDRITLLMAIRTY